MIIYIVLVILFFSAIIVNQDTKTLIYRSDELQKALNKLIEKENLK